MTVGHAVLNFFVILPWYGWSIGIGVTMVMVWLSIVGVMMFNPFFTPSRAAWVWLALGFVLVVVGGFNVTV